MCAAAEPCLNELTFRQPSKKSPVSLSSRQPSATKPGPGLFVKLTASSLLTAGILIGLEFGAGFIVSPQQRVQLPDDAVSRTIAYLDVNPVPLATDADVLWRNKPGSSKTQPVNPEAFGRRDQWTLKNNSDGFRGPELSRPNDEGETFRILCVGDSITFGFSTDQGSSYPRQLERLLATRYPNRRFEVINAGVPGWSYLQGLRFLEARGIALAPDLIIIGHGTNDQLFRVKITDRERLGELTTSAQKMRQRFSSFAASTNIYRAISGDRPIPSPDEPSPGCVSQIANNGRCNRVAIGEIASALEVVVAL
ncbi:MAG: hypothetical protein ACI8TX_002754, partial [Hyphomicrobiaceae bacterium]